MELLNFCVSRKNSSAKKCITTQRMECRSNLSVARNWVRLEIEILQSVDPLQNIRYHFFSRNCNLFISLIKVAFDWEFGYAYPSVLCVFIVIIFQKSFFEWNIFANFFFISISLCTSKWVQILQCYLDLFSLQMKKRKHKHPSILNIGQLYTYFIIVTREFSVFCPYNTKMCARFFRFCFVDEAP